MRLGSETVRKLCGDLAYRFQVLKEALARRSVVLVTERAVRRRATRQQVENCFAALKRAFGLGATLAKTLVGFATRIAVVCRRARARRRNREADSGDDRVRTAHGYPGGRGGGWKRRSSWRACAGWAAT